MTAPRFEAISHGDCIRITVDLGPMVDPLTIVWPLADVERAVAEARAIQLGVDVWGNL